MIKACAGGCSVAENRFQTSKEQNLVTLIAVGRKKEKVRNIPVFKP